MQPLNEDKIFSPILTQLENGEMKTVNNLRLALDALAEEANITTLHMLELFRAWLLTHNLDLITTYGAVSLAKAS